MILKTIYIEETPEKFDQWLRQLASEQGYNLSVSQQDDRRRYQVKREGEAVAEIETVPVRDRLRLRPARLRLQRTPGGMARSDFIEMLDKALQSDYRAEPIEGKISGSFMHGIIDLEREQFDNPEDDAKRQAYVAELSRGLPPLAPTEPPTAQAQATDATPTKPTAQAAPVMQAQSETRRAENQIVPKPAVISTRRNVIIGLLLIFSIALVLIALTLLVVWGVLPYQFAQNLFYIGLAILAATTILAAWNSILSLVERLFNRSR